MEDWEWSGHCRCWFRRTETMFLMAWESGAWLVKDRRSAAVRAKGKSVGLETGKSAAEEAGRQLSLPKSILTG